MKLKKSILLAVTIVLFTANTKFVFAGTNDTAKSIKEEIEYEELKQSTASLKADIARARGISEQSSVIRDLQKTWKNSENKKQELLKKLNHIKNNRTFVGRFKLTGYCPCYSCSENWGKQTASGKIAVDGITVAADAKVIPLGTRVYIEGVGERVVQDTGGAIKGNKIDVFVNSHKSAYKPEYNRSDVKLWVIK